LQVPLAHAAVAFGSEQAFPQEPQLVVVVIGVSQPSEALLLQSPNPALHAIPHVPLLHCAEPPVVEHLLPQLPQLVVVLSAVSQPSVGSLLQSA
jgi:hypothetical protein